MTVRVPLAVLLILAVLLPLCLVPTVDGAAHLQTMGAESLMNGERLISQAATMPDTDRHLPDVAWNFVNDQYLVVWHNNWPGNRDIYARRVTRDGTLLAWFNVPCPGNCLQPSVAYSASNAEYLIVYMVDVHGDGSQYEIWGTITAWDGTYFVGPFLIMGWTNRSFWTPRVVWNNNRNEYFVVWNAFDITAGPPGVPNDIAGKRVFGDSSVEANATILTTSTEPHQVDLAYNWSTDEWFIAFVRSYLPSATGNDIYGQRVSYDGGGNLVPGSIIEIYSGSKHQDAPAAIVDGQGSYMVVWQHEYEAADHDVYAQKLGWGGNKLGGVYPLATSSLDETNPAVTASFDSSPEYVATWARTTATGQAIMAHRWGDGLAPLNFEISNVTFWENDRPAIAPGRPGYWIVYEGDDLAVTRQIYGRRLVPNTAFLPIVVRNR